MVEDATGSQMKNIQVIDGALNSVYDMFGVTEHEFSLIFTVGQDVAFIDEVIARGPEDQLDAALNNTWKRRIAKKDAMGIHGLLFYEMEQDMLLSNAPRRRGN